jgi:hypothetical protein
MLSSRESLQSIGRRYEDDGEDDEDDSDDVDSKDNATSSPTTSDIKSTNTMQFRELSRQVMTT